MSDIYITNDLAFDLNTLSKEVHKINNKCQIRVYCNIAQSALVLQEQNSLKSFFIRPEDVDLYEKYIDVLEFYGVDEKLETYYKIYVIDKK